MQQDQLTKEKMSDLMKRLNSAIELENLHSEIILEISRELDALILESYSNNLED